MKPCNTLEGFMNATNAPSLPELKAQLESFASQVGDCRLTDAFRTFSTLAERLSIADAAPRSLWESEKVRLVMESLLESEVLLGEVGEFGTYKGGGTFIMADTLRKMDSDRHLFTVDSFRTMPAEGGAAAWEGASAELLRQQLALFGLARRVTVLEGFFQDVLPPRLSGDVFSLVVLDCGSHDGTRYCLEFLWDIIVPGGIVLVNDYPLPGVRRAVDEFLADKAETIVDRALNMVRIRRM